jgi:hypothetical protein
MFGLETVSYITHTPETKKNRALLPGLSRGNKEIAFSLFDVWAKSDNVNAALAADVKQGTFEKIFKSIVRSYKLNWASFIPVYVVFCLKSSKPSKMAGEALYLFSKGLNPFKGWNMTYFVQFWLGKIEGVIFKK